MSDFPKDIYQRPANIDVHTLNNLGPLRRMAGVWQGQRGQDLGPTANGGVRQPFVERMELHPTDPQTNGPQLFYGLRYHLHVTQPNDSATFHEQVGYWLWEPATGTVIQTLTVPRGMTVMAAGQATADAQQFELNATQGLDHWGICSNPFLNHAFKTVAYKIQVQFHDDGSWSYDEDTVLKITGQAELFHHTDRNQLVKVGEPVLNPLARATGKQ